jgi:hypothetical protein
MPIARSSEVRMRCPHWHMVAPLRPRLLSGLDQNVPEEDVVPVHRLTDDLRLLHLCEERAEEADGHG